METIEIMKIAYFHYFQLSYTKLVVVCIMNEDQIPKWLKLKARKGIYNTVTVFKDF